MVPPGLKNIALGKKLTSSDTNATATVLEKITDGDKNLPTRALSSCAKAHSGCR